MKKKLTPRARKKELTGVNLAALKKRIVTLELAVKYLLRKTDCLPAGPMPEGMIKTGNATFTWRKK